MIDVCENQLCTGCGACAQKCPRHCITMLEDSEGFLRPNIDQKRCTDCSLCQKTCPILAAQNYLNAETKAYAFINSNEEIRMASSSGGLFTELAKWVLEKDGLVFGAAYDDKFAVFHKCIESIDELDELRRAKYSQSNIGEVYCTVKNELDSGRYIIFSGTPCQIAALRSYLHKDYERLYLMDFVCHGVPSPKVWQHYLAYRRELDGQNSDIASVNLRSKITGWASYSVNITFENGDEYSSLAKDDAYIRGFVGNLFLRPSCYNCQFKGLKRESDFTVGDYWGVWNQYPTFNDNKGTTVVLANSEKAKRLWNEIAENSKVLPIDLNHCMDENPSAVESSKIDERREQFFEEFENTDFEGLIDRLLPRIAPAKSGITKRIIKKGKNLIKRLIG